MKTCPESTLGLLLGQPPPHSDGDGAKLREITPGCSGDCTNIHSSINCKPLRHCCPLAGFLLFFAVGFLKFLFVMGRVNAVCDLERGQAAPECLERAGETAGL